MNRTAVPVLPVAYYAWSPATDTTELPAVLRGHEQPTTELRLLDLPPAVEPTTARPSLLARAWNAARRSPSLNAAIQSAFWPAVLSAGLLIGVALFAHRGMTFTPSGGSL